MSASTSQSIRPSFTQFYRNHFLIGHKLFERNAAVGDIRVLRKDFSPLWFIVANHVLTFEMGRKAIRVRTTDKTA